MVRKIIVVVVSIAILAGGIFLKKTSFEMLGKLFFVTVEGPPDKIIPFISLKFLILLKFFNVSISE